MLYRERIEIGQRVRIEGTGFERMFRGRVGTLLGYTRAGWARVRLDDARPWESLISAERDDNTGLPVIIVVRGCIRGESAPF
jgi:hypothetical protein